ncbi:DNA cytosine methyltransferase [Lysinibacillus sphaericus]|uniref:DNA cytosine methyltransferase n=1 Tax=Lysinibacillus sphaericus TaxID=1421 RepID=UPI0018CC8497|nr:DNA cytosine methyltransferase [Lysinibacillus sphaericus]
MKIKTIKASARGITFSDISLFPIGTKVRYQLDRSERKLIISPSIDGEREVTVSRKKSGNNYIPLLDIRSKDVLELFADADKLDISISDDQVIVTSTADNNTTSVSFDKTELFAAAGVDANTEFLAQAVTVASFFSGAGLLDAGFSAIKDYRIVFALEKDSDAALTYRVNHGDHIHIGDICELTCDEVPPVDVIIGGPPCQGHSNANRRTNYLDNPNNLLLKEYLRIIKGNPATKVFVLENVPELLTGGDGQFAEEIYEALKEFEISTGILDSVDYGSAQSRKRAILIGSRIGRIELPNATHSPAEYNTVANALHDIHEAIVNQQDVSIPRPKTRERFTFIPEGANWEALPKHLLGKMRKGLTHSNILRRLSWDSPSITLPNVRKSNILHPTENRILSIREIARLFDLPDSFEFVGKLSSMQQQLANGVPFRLGNAIAKQIIEVFKRIRQSKCEVIYDYIHSLREDDFYAY